MLEGKFTKSICTINDSEKYECYYDPFVNWNGWIVPYFTKEVAQQVIADINANKTNGTTTLTWRGEDIIMWEQDSEAQVIEPAQLQYDGQTITVYCIGGYEWVWDLAHTFEDNEQQEYLDKMVTLVKKFNEAAKELSYHFSLDASEGIDCNNYICDEIPISNSFDEFALDVAAWAESIEKNVLIHKATKLTEQYFNKFDTIERIDKLVRRHEMLIPEEKESEIALGTKEHFKLFDTDKLQYFCDDLTQVLSGTEVEDLDEPPFFYKG
jgi:hypothetical protein